MTTTDIAGLCERLRAVESSRGPSNWSGIREVTTNWHRNPDGPPAANTLEYQAAENKRLRGLLGELIDYAEECIARLDCHDAGIMGDEPVKAARAALTGEDT